MTDDKHIDCECIIPEEMAKLRGMEYQLNAAGHVISASLPAPFIIDQLYRLGILDDSQFFFATQFLSMRRRFLEGVSHKGHRFYEAPATEPEPIRPITIDPWDYLHVCRAITNHRDQAILRDAVDEHSDRVTLDRLRANRERVRHAFEHLQRIVSALWESKKDCAEGGCNKCDGRCITERFRENNPCAIRPVVAD